MYRAGMLAALALAVLAAVPADAQLKLRGNYVYNRASVDAQSARLNQPKQGYGAGLDVILPGGLGIGLSGYTSGRASGFESATSQVVVLGEANYFLRLPLRITPYAGIHSSLGAFTGEYFKDPHLPGFEDDLGGLGYQAGVRFQPFGPLGLDVQWRRLSAHAASVQHPSFQREQILLGLTLF